MSDTKKYSAQEAAIAVLKKAEELLKKSELAKAERSGGKQGVKMRSDSDLKGVHRPLTIGGESVESGRSLAGIKTANAQRNKGTVSGKVDADYAKEKHKQVLSDLKTMPKPNLPKSEGMDKAEKLSRGKHNDQKQSEVVSQRGVHTPSDNHPGESFAGATVRSGHKGSKSQARGFHADVLSDLKSMPKPNLPKSEGMDKSGEEQQKLTSIKPTPSSSNQPALEISSEGSPKSSTMNQAEQDMAFIPVKSIGSAKLSKFMEYRHAKKKAQAARGLQEQAPVAPTAEMGKGETGHEKGIHTSDTPISNKYVGEKKAPQGTSVAGSDVREANASRPGSKMKENFKRQAIGEHKQVLGEIKAMKPPKLPR